jgi:hypothetical protein
MTVRRSANQISRPDSLHQGCKLCHYLPCPQIEPAANRADTSEADQSSKYYVTRTAVPLGDSQELYDSTRCIMKNQQHETLSRRSRLLKRSVTASGRCERHATIIASRHRFRCLTRELPFRFRVAVDLDPHVELRIPKKEIVSGFCRKRMTAHLPSIKAFQYESSMTKPGSKGTLANCC